MVAMSRKSRVAGTAFRFRRVTSSDSFGTVGRGILCATIIYREKFGKFYVLCLFLFPESIVGVLVCVLLG